MIQFDNSKAGGNGKVVLNFEGSPLMLAAEISAVLHQMYFTIRERDESSGESFKDYFLTGLDIMWSTDEEINRHLVDLITKKLSNLASVDRSDADTDCEGDDDEWD